MLRFKCGDQYVGQTGRSFQERFKEEHLRDCNQLSNCSPKDSASAMARHCYEEHHPYNEVVSSPIHPCPKGRNLNRLEEYHIVSTLNKCKSTSNTLLNNTDHVTFNNFSRYMLNLDHQVMSWFLLLPCIKAFLLRSSVRLKKDCVSVRNRLWICLVNNTAKNFEISLFVWFLIFNVNPFVIQLILTHLYFLTDLVILLCVH